jgi:hypothetical protein
MYKITDGNEVQKIENWDTMIATPIPATISVEEVA